jgi:hypothetical protein
MAASRIWATTRQRIFRYRLQEFWAENGLVHVVETTTGLYSPVSVAEFLQRARGFNKAAERGKHDKRWIDERDELTRMVQDMIVCCQQARAQGDPFDPRELRRMVDHHRPGRVSMASVSAAPPRHSRIIVTGG